MYEKVNIYLAEIYGANVSPINNDESYCIFSNSKIQRIFLKNINPLEFFSSIDEKIKNKSYITPLQRLIIFILPEIVKPFDFGLLIKCLDLSFNLDLLDHPYLLNPALVFDWLYSKKFTAEQWVIYFRRNKDIHMNILRDAWEEEEMEEEDMEEEEMEEEEMEEDRSDESIKVSWENYAMEELLVNAEAALTKYGYTHKEIENMLGLNEIRI
jgi:hypothetical protein